ncbi:hypothetical protein PGB90_008812 [Kerria lacca]
MANVTESNTNRESSQKSQNQNNFETLDKTVVSTLKRNPKIEFCKSDLLKLLTYLEGELQAREIVIATLKSEKLKQYLVQNKHMPQKDSNDPIAALQRDSFAVIDHSRDTSDMCLFVNHQLNSLENLVIQQRRSQARVARVLKEAEIRHRKEIELEIQNRKRFEKEYLKLNEIIELERNRHKQIVLFLLAERKKIIMKYVEERKRSEDLAQILAEEKGRVDAMAEGLEEESKKSLRMEAEMEKQSAQFYTEKQQLNLIISKNEKRCKELEAELEKNQKENLFLREQLTELRNQHDKDASQNTNSASISTAPSLCSGAEATINTVNSNIQCVTPMMTSIAKVIQPTATVSSVPVSGPTTGIARSVSPGQHVRYVMYSPASPNLQIMNTGKLNESVTQYTPITLSNVQERIVAPSATIRSATIANSPHPKLASSSVAKNHSGEMVPAFRKLPLGRGVPPPVPPNKPIIPPKKDGILNRKMETIVPENSDLKNFKLPRGIVLQSSKVKSANTVDKHDEPVKNDPVADNPG